MNRAIVATLISFTIVVALCPLTIPILQKLRFGQTVRQLGPKSHYKKAGTPTMGGVVIILGIVLSGALFIRSGDTTLFFAILITVVFGLIGFLDDYIKIIQRNTMSSDKGVSVASLGMSVKHKLVLQFSVAIALAVYAAYHSNIGTEIIVPFISKTLDLGWIFIPFVVLVTVSVVNAVNLTDGLDGLACGVSTIVLVFFLYAAFGNGFVYMGIFSATVIGACMGFMCYNFNPAKVFMGDTGSMALGGAVAVVSILTRTELFILIAGAVYVIEELSVALQVVYYKLTHGKRLFKMAPIHHHFELSGWVETRIVVVFCIASIICVLISLLGLNFKFY